MILRNEEPWYLCRCLSLTRLFLLGPLFFGPCSCGLSHREWERGRDMWFGYTVEMAQLLKIKVLLLSICAKGCKLDHCVCVI